MTKQSPLQSTADWNINWLTTTIITDWNIYHHHYNQQNPQAFITVWPEVFAAMINNGLNAHHYSQQHNK